MIRTPDQRLRVFVSSSLRELADERQAVSRAISALRLTPVLFELGARPHHPRDLYRAYLDQSDVFIGLYWRRYGHIAAGMEVSGLEEEFELARAMPRLLYVKVPAPDREPRLGELLERVEQEASYRTFRSPGELGRLVRDDLATLLSERFAVSGPQRRLPAKPRPLPADTTTLFGRGRDVEQVASLLGRPDVRLVTLTGPGGIGKTRLAVAVGERLRGRFEDGAVFLPLAAVALPEQVLPTIARAVGADPPRTDAPVEPLAERLADGTWLLILDNLEHVADVACHLDELLTRCRGVTILATSRRALGLRAERDYPVPPLMLPDDPTAVTMNELGTSPAVALFVDRARVVRHDFVLTEDNAPAVAEICRRLEGVPLAIELAAARTLLLEPDALLRRLARSLDALGTGTADMPARQRTLRAAVEWSVGLLDEAELALLEIVAVFVDGWTVEAAAEVAGLSEDRALELTEALARHSLVQLHSTEFGRRARMLETIREFVAERLAARPDIAEVERRHANHYRGLVEQADRPLRGAGHSEWLGRLDLEAGNLATAIGWYLAHDPLPLPRLFRILFTFWTVRDHNTQAGTWLAQLVPAAGYFEPEARAELLWTAFVTARDVGDHAAALAARDQLEPLLEQVRDPYIHATSELAMAWASAVDDDFDDALRRALSSLERLRRQDEPIWTGVAAATVGTIEAALDRTEDAYDHLHEAQALAERFDSRWLSAWCRVQLGIVAVARDELADARAVLDEGLELSLIAHTTQMVAMCLAAFARLAFAEGDAEQAARLAGGAAGLRRRAGLTAWPTQRYAEDELAAVVREKLGSHRFDHLFLAGSQLSRHDAVAACRERPRSLSRPAHG